MPYEKVDLVMERRIKPSNLIQSDPPWTVYHRPLGWLTDQIQGWQRWEVYIISTKTT
jgi:hypothetical protein